MDRFIDRLLSFFGGVVVAYASMLTVICLARILNWNWSWLFVASAACLIVPPTLSFIWGRYFMSFAFVINFLINGGDHSAGLRDWDIFLLGVAEAIALIVLTGTLLFPAPILLTIGVVLFVLFATLAPRMMTDERMENYSGE